MSSATEHILPRGRDIATDQERLSLGIFRVDARKSESYKIYFGTKEALKRERTHLGWLIALKRVPKVWEDGTRLHLESLHTDHTYVGHMRYVCRKRFLGVFGADSAINERYYPLESANRKDLRRMPYFIEAIIVNQLRNEGIKLVHSSGVTFDPLRNQLKRVNLRHDRYIEISAWLKAMGRGISEHRKERAALLQKQS